MTRNDSNQEEQLSYQDSRLSCLKPWKKVSSRTCDVSPGTPAQCQRIVFEEQLVQFPEVQKNEKRRSVLELRSLASCEPESVTGLDYLVESESVGLVVFSGIAMRAKTVVG